jgi:hypothetical protein
MTSTLDCWDANQPSQFEMDDIPCHPWLRENPKRLASSSERTCVSCFVVLHRTDCRHISSPKRSCWFTTGLIKTCSRDPGRAAWRQGCTQTNESTCHATFLVTSVPHGVRGII